MRLACVAGETSGDLLGASVLAGLKAAQPQQVQHFAGIGGPALIAQGLQPWWTIDALSVRGYVEVLAALPRLLWMRRQLRQRILVDKPDLFLGIDAPDFNLGLERRLREAGIRTVHFISPSVWAWRRERLAGIRASVDHMLLVFPMEQAIYREAGIPATYVGHPMADEIALQPDVAAARGALGLKPDDQVVALLPGSRLAEINFLIEPFLETARRMQAQRPGLRFVLPAASAALLVRIRAQIERAGLPDQLSLSVFEGRARECLAACDAALIASGTATLEAALLKKPMVIAYRMPALSYRRMKDMGYLPWIGLPNILCNDWVVPEFVQDAVQPAALAQALLGQLDDGALREQLGRRFADLHLSLRQGCGQRSAQVLMELVDGKV